MDSFAADVDEDIVVPSLFARNTPRACVEKEEGERPDRMEEDEKQEPPTNQHVQQRAAPEIKAIDRSSVARICSGQVKDKLRLRHFDAFHSSFSNCFPTKGGH